MEQQWRELGLSPQLEVKEKEGWGRGVYAAATLSTGSEVMHTEPLVHVLSNDVRGQLCDFCLRESQTLLKCGRCKFVRYCNIKCQRGDWRFHRGECGGIARARPHFPTPLTRLVVRCLLTTSEVDVRDKTEPLCSHEDKLSGEVEEEAATLMIGVRLLLDNPQTGDIQKAYAILCKALCNSFTIHGMGLDPIGAGIYVGPSLLNHSCLPNCVAVFSGTCMAVRTIQPLQTGDQLLVSYVDLLEASEERRKTFVRSYSFRCGCERCLTEMNPDSPFATMYASIEGSTAVSVSEAVEEGAKSLDKIEDLGRKGDSEAMILECQSALSRAGGVLRNCHHITVKTLRQLVYASIAVGDWPKAIEASRKLTEPLRRYLPEFHPVLGVHYLRLGKLLRVSESTTELAQSVLELTQAVEQLRVVYGPGNSTTLEALQMLHDSQCELRHRGSVAGGPSQGVCHRGST